MSDYTPTTEEIRERWMNFDGGPDAKDAEEFDRWFLSEIAKAARTGAEEALRIIMEEPVTFRGTHE